jgi:hypothetical protein
VYSLVHGSAIAVGGTKLAYVEEVSPVLEYYEPIVPVSSWMVRGLGGGVRCPFGWFTHAVIHCVFVSLRTSSEHRLSSGAPLYRIDFGLAIEAESRLN